MEGLKTPRPLVTQVIPPEHPLGYNRLRVFFGKVDFLTGEETVEEEVGTFEETPEFRAGLRSPWRDGSENRIMDVTIPGGPILVASRLSWMMRTLREGETPYRPLDGAAKRKMKRPARRSKDAPAEARDVQGVLL